MRDKTHSGVRTHPLANNHPGSLHIPLSRWQFYQIKLNFDHATRKITPILLQAFVIILVLLFQVGMLAQARVSEWCRACPIRFPSCSAALGLVVFANPMYASWVLCHRSVNMENWQGKFTLTITIFCLLVEYNREDCWNWRIQWRVVWLQALTTWTWILVYIPRRTGVNTY